MPDYDGATCSCGSTWFRLKPALPDMPTAAVTLDHRGIVTGYTGKATCNDCGVPWVPPRERLRVVGDD